MPSSAEAFAPENKRDAGQQTQCNSAGWTNPAAVEGVLDEVGDSNQDGNNPDPVQPQLPNLALEFFLLSSSRRE